MADAIVKLVLDPRMRDFCKRPYEGHPGGCPNYGRQAGCPPTTPMIGEALDLSQTVHAVWVEFDLEAQRRRMWARHPKWSKRQAECCLYWQGGVDRSLGLCLANLQTVLESLFSSGKELRDVYRPEAYGVDVTATMKKIGIELQWPPDTVVYKVALVGTARKGKVK